MDSSCQTEKLATKWAHIAVQCSLHKLEKKQWSPLYWLYIQHFSFVNSPQERKSHRQLIDYKRRRNVKQVRQENIESSFEKGQSEATENDVEREMDFEAFSVMDDIEESMN